MRNPARYPTDQLRLGAKVYRFQCSVCHTVAGANGLTHLSGSWSPQQLRMNVAKLQHTKPFMPPFAGNARELEALAQWMMWTNAGTPARWRSNEAPGQQTQNQRWLDEAGIAPGTGERYRRATE